MSNIDKRAQKDLYAKVEQQAHSLRGSPREYQAVTGMCPVNIIEMQAQKIQVLLDELEAAEKRIAELTGQKRVIGWRMADYTDETADPALAKNWASAVDVLPIFEGDVNTKLSAAAAGKGE